jgi:predicted Zn finger-like uncharacterized protein
MRITCPNCQAAYNVPEIKLMGRRAVRCSRCGKDWTPEISLPETSPEPDLPDISHADQTEQSPLSEPEPANPQSPIPHFRPSAHEFTAMQRLARTAEPPRPSVWARVAWALSLALVVLMLWSAFNWRTDIMRIWPPSTRAYAALGLTDTGK